MMANGNSDTLFQLIVTLEKSEKRHFKLYIKRSSSKQDLKIIRLFDAMVKLSEYDEKLLLKKLPGVTKTQLYNLKTHLYKQLLASLRLLRTSDNTDLKLDEHLDNARLLYNKGLKLQSLNILEKAKELARANQKYNFLVQALSLEKKIETLHITRSSLEKTRILAEESTVVSEHIDRVTRLSNLALLLYRWYVQNGHARHEHDEKAVTGFFNSSLPRDPHAIDGFYEKLYLYQSYCWYGFIRQDFLMYYRNSQKWIDLFEENPVMVSVETGHYVKGMHNLLDAHFVLRNFKKFDSTLLQFEKFSKTAVAKQHDNFRIHTSIYINSAKINRHLMQGTFKDGLYLIPHIVEKLNEYSVYVDTHRILVINYKIATLYFGAGLYSDAIDYLRKIINETHRGLRNDLQCYARLMHLLCHYEIGNEEILDSLIRSVYRFMAKMKNLTVVEEQIFKFLRYSLNANSRQIKPALEQLLENIRHLEKDPFETRSFSYLDIISWLESKIYEKPIDQVIHEKYLKSKHRNTARSRESGVGKESGARTRKSKRLVDSQ